MTFICLTVSYHLAGLGTWGSFNLRAGKANPCQAADQYMQCVYQMIDNQVLNIFFQCPDSCIASLVVDNDVPHVTFM